MEMCVDGGCKNRNISEMKLFLFISLVMTVAKLVLTFHPLKVYLSSFFTFLRAEMSKRRRRSEKGLVEEIETINDLLSV